MGIPISCCSYTIRSQQGVVLIVGLVMVLLISIIALAAIKGSGLQEAMLGNARDRNVAFQAAEAGLSLAESIIDQDRVSTPPACPTSGVCVLDLDRSPANSVIYFDDAKWTAQGVTTSTMSLSTKSQPIYIIEELQPYRPDDGSALDGISSVTEVIPYRLSAKGVGLTGLSSGTDAASTVVVQSFYHRTP